MDLKTGDGTLAEISYPKFYENDEEAESYKWFGANRSIREDEYKQRYKSVDMPPTVFETLPELTSKKDDIYIKNDNLHLYSFMKL